MIKKITFKKIVISSLLLLLAIIMYSYPKQLSETNYKPSIKNQNIYLPDKQNFIAMTKITINNSSIEKSIPQIINCLIKENKFNKKIPIGFKPILPKGTVLLDFSLNNNLLKLNFNEHFLNISINDEEKAIEALIFSLTELEKIDKIMIFINGQKLTKLPKSNKNLGLYLDRSYGINKIYNINSINNSSIYTIYYLSKYNNNKYYVPISFITNNNKNDLRVLIKHLQTNPITKNNLSSQINKQIKLMNYEINENNVLLDFNNVILQLFSNDKLKEEIEYSIAYSIYDTLNIKKIEILVNNTKIDEIKLEK